MPPRCKKFSPFPWLKLEAVCLHPPFVVGPDPGSQKCRSGWSGFEVFVWRWIVSAMSPEIQKWSHKSKWSLFTYTRRIVKLFFMWWKIDRYKYVVVVSIGPTPNNELIIASRCLLNPVSDTFAEYTFDERGLYAVAVVYAFYREWNSHRQCALCHTVRKSASISDKCFMQMALVCLLYKFLRAAKVDRTML